MSFQLFYISLLTLALTSFAACKSKLEVKSAATKKAGESSDFQINAPESAYLGEKITIEWSEIKEAQYYNLVIATDEACDDVAFSFEELVQTQSIITTTSPGTYYLCVFVKVKGKPLFKANDESVKFSVLVSNPMVKSVSTSLSDGTFGIGSVIDIKVTFDQVVSIDGPLKLKLETGATDRVATYVSGYGSKVLTFNYTVQAGDESVALDVSSSYPNLYDGTIRNSYNVSADMSLPFGFMDGSLSQNHQIKVDGVSPVVSSGTLSSDPAYLTGTSFKITWTGATDSVASASELEYKLVYSTSDNISTAADAEANGIDVGTYTANILESSPGALTPLTTYYFNVLVRDLGGNVSVYSRGTETTPTGPSITSVITAKADGSYTVGEIIDLEVTYDESVTVAGGTPTLKLETGSTDRTAAYTSGSPGTTLTFRYTVQSGDTSTDLDVNATAPQISLAGATIKSTNTNANANHSAPKGADPGSLAGSSDIVIDTTAPTVGTPALTIAVTDVGAMDVRVSWTAASDNIAAASDLQYQVVYSITDNVSTLSQAKANGTVGVAYTANITQGDITGLTPATIYYFNVIVKDEAGNESVYTKKNNPVPPTLTFTAPTGTNIIAQSATFALTWTAADANGLNPSIALYYGTVNTGTCSSKTLLNNALTMNGTAGTYNWSVSAVTPGTYYVCAVIDNGATSPVTAWSPGTITVNAAPTFTFVQPMASDDFLKAGGDFTVTWTDGDADDDATISLYYKTSGSGACSTGTQFATNISEDSATNSETWTTLSTTGSSAFYFCARISDGVNPAVEVWSGPLVVFHECLWNTGGTTAWETTSNWSGCNSVIPTQYDRVVIPAGGSQPLVTVNRTIASFGGFATGGGTVTVSSNRTLTVTGNAPGVRVMSSDVSFAGATVPCTDCRVSFSPSDPLVAEDAKLTLLDGVTLNGAGNGCLNFGNGTSPGHFATNAANVSSGSWPILNSNYCILFSGTSGQLSSLNIDGLTFNTISGSNQTRLNDYYHIIKFDNVNYIPSVNDTDNQNTRMTLSNCDHATFADTNWENVNFTSQPSSAAFSIDANTCTGIGPITVTGSGRGHGEKMERDPNNVINWSNGTSMPGCTWTGANNSEWNNSANWSNCNNGRNNYPDGNDWVIIPSGGTQPVVSGYSNAFGFAAGTGGGTITVNANSTFTVRGLEEWVESSIAFQGGTAGCTTCKVKSGSNIRNATLTLLQNIRFEGNRYPWIRQSGSLVIDGGLDPSNWPTYYIHDSQVGCQGIVGQPATININGAKLERHVYRLYNYCNVVAFKNVNMMIAGTNLHTFEIASCTDSVLAGNWENLYFNAPPKTTNNYFVKTSASCSGAGPIHIYPDGTGGPGYQTTVIQDDAGMFIFH